MSYGPVVAGRKIGRIHHPVVRVGQGLSCSGRALSCVFDIYRRHVIKAKIDTIKLFLVTNLVTSFGRMNRSKLYFM